MTDFWEEFLNIKPYQTEKFRRIRKSLYGLKKTLIFFEPDGVPAQGSLIKVSEKITYRFSVEKISCEFPQGIGNDLRIYVLVSDDDELKKTGTSLLKNFTNIDYMIGDGKLIEVYVSQEFPENKYIKVYAENISTTPQDLNVFVEIIIYPVLSFSEL